MAEVKWIKIVTDIFDDEKMLLIESLPSADSLIVIWFKLLCLAGKNNNDGVFIMNDRIPYTEEMLSTIFRRDINIVRLALNTFEQFGMIEIVNGVITIPNWGKHQTLDSYEKKKARDKLYQAERRAKQKQLTEKSSDKSSDESSDKSSDIAISDIDIEEEIEIDIEREKEKNKKDKPARHKYGEYGHVLLTDEQYERLCNEFGEESTKQAIKKVDEYCQQYGKSYKDYNLTIRKWGFNGIATKKNGTNDPRWSFLND